MPLVRYYTVREIREVKLWTNSAVEASVLASEAFENRKALGIAAGEIIAPPRVIGLEIADGWNVGFDPEVGHYIQVTIF